MTTFYTHDYALVPVDKKHKHLFLTGLTKESRPVIARVIGWTTTLDIKVRVIGKLAPIVMRNALENEKNTLAAVINGANDDADDGIAIVGHEYVDLDSYNQWSPTKTKFHRLRVKFDNYVSLEVVMKALSTAGYQMTDCLKETSLFRLDYGLKPTQWISITGSTEIDHDDLSQRQPMRITVDAADIVSLDDSHGEPPRALIATYDIETFSSLYERGRMPDYHLPKDAIYCISYVLVWSDTKEPHQKFCITVCPDEVGQLRSEGIEIIQVGDEDDLITELSHLINATDPDALISYNGMGYDYSYIKGRAEEHYDGVPAFGRIKISAKEHFEEFEWRGAGNSFHKYIYPQAFGRVNIDVLLVAKRTKLDEIGHNRGIHLPDGKLRPESDAKDDGPRSHKLDDVGEFFVGERKIGLTYREQFAIYANVLAKNTDDASPTEKKAAVDDLSRIVDYCVQDSVLCAKVFFEMKTWIECRESAAIMFQTMSDVFITGQTRKFAEQLYRRLRKRGFFAMATKMKTPTFSLKGGYVGKPIKGYHRDICVIDFASMYPSMQMMYNICPSAFVPNLRGLSDADKANFLEVKMTKQVGLISMPAEYQVPPNFDIQRFTFGRFRDDERTMFARLGIDEDTMKTNPSKAYDRTYIEEIMADEGYRPEYHEAFVNEICDTYNLPSIYAGREEQLIVYLNQSREGIMTENLRDLKETRSALKKAIKTAPNKTIKDIYDKRQNAIKVLMNSFYGICGTQEGDYGFMEGSAAITYFGRTSIQAVNAYLETKGAEIVYGDTDSSFFKMRTEFPLTPEGRRQLIEITDALVDDINKGLLRSPLYPGCEKAIGITSGRFPVSMELEKIMDALLIEKKKYVGQITIADSKLLPTPKMIIRGIALARGDTLPFTKIAYKAIINMLFPTTPTDDTVADRKAAINAYIDEQLAKLMSGDVDRDLLTMTKKLGHDYSSATAPMAVYARYLQEHGEYADPGTRLAFVVSSGKGSVGQRYRPPTTNDAIDYGYYADLARTPLEQFATAIQGG